MWNLPSPPGFQGLREDLPLKAYEQLLPHWPQDGATYFVTFRLGDSLPQSKLHELRGLRIQWERKFPPPRTQENLDAISRKIFVRMEEWLGQGMGSCVLREPRCAKLVVDQLQAAQDDAYELGCYVIMPNHVHAVVRPLRSGAKELEAILQTWKGASAAKLSAVRGGSGSLWQRESFDRIVRDEEHLWRAIQYVGRNGSRAGLRAGEFVRWINPRWEELGWKFVE